MALLTELVATCEQHDVDKGATLNVFARRLREAGRLSQAGRGRGAAQMTFLDGARFLIALAATDHPERAVEAEAAFSSTIEDAGLETLDEALATFLEALAAGEIDAATDPGPHPDIVRLGPVCYLMVNRSSVAAELRINDHRRLFNHPALRDVVTHMSDPEKRKKALQEYELATLPFRTGKVIRAELELKLFRAVADLIAGKGAT